MARPNQDTFPPAEYMLTAHGQLSMRTGDRPGPFNPPRPNRSSRMAGESQSQIDVHRELAGQETLDGFRNVIVVAIREQTDPTYERPHTPIARPLEPLPAIEPDIETVEQTALETPAGGTVIPLPLPGPGEQFELSFARAS